MSRIGVVLLNYGHPSDLMRSIDSVRPHSRIRYYVVDNDSPGNVRADIDSHFSHRSDVVVIQNGSNNGYASGNNLGLSSALEDDCDILIVANPDVSFSVHTLLRIEDTLKDSSIGVVGPVIYAPDLTEQTVVRDVPTSLRLLARRRPFLYFARLLRKLSVGSHHSELELLKFRGMVSGCFFGMSAETLREIGGLDTGTFLYHEEDLLALKLSSVGKLTCVDRTASIVHSGGGSTSSQTVPFVRFHHYLSSIYTMRLVGANFLFMGLLLLINQVSFFLKSVNHGSYRKLCMPLLKWQIQVSLGRALPIDARDAVGLMGAG